MGYTTELYGTLKTDKQLELEQVQELEVFADTRHGGNINHDKDKPGFWCQWVPTEDGWGLEWNGNEKFYNYVEWLEYLIEHFFKKWDVRLNGEIEWKGEESGDLGKIIVTDNVVEVKEAQWKY